jgi:molybdenum cofactor cytidylyltransferase
MTTTRIAGILLAAGQATRYREAAGADGPATKLVATYQGKALVRHVAEAGIAAGLAPLVVVTGHAREAVGAALAELPLTFAHNADFATGMASSVKAGLAQVPPEAAGALVLLGDMPLVSPGLISKLVEAFAKHPQAVAVLPVHAGERGNPVLLSRAMFADILQLNGDAGARQVLRGREADVIEVPVDEQAARLDVDTPAELNELGQG